MIGLGSDKNARKQTHIKIQFYNRKKVTSFKIFILTFLPSPNHQLHHGIGHLLHPIEDTEDKAGRGAIVEDLWTSDLYRCCSLTQVLVGAR